MKPTTKSVHAFLLAAALVVAGLVLDPVAAASPVWVEKAPGADNAPCFHKAGDSTRNGRPIKFCPLWKGGVPVYQSPAKGNDGRQIDTLRVGGSANWFIGQSERSSYTYDSYTNNWWAYTLGDGGNWGWVPEVFFSGGGNNVADAGLGDCFNGACDAGGAAGGAVGSGISPRMLPPEPSESCEIDVRSSEVFFGFASHLFIVYTDGAGKQTGFRGGPEGDGGSSGSSSSSSDSSSGSSDSSSGSSDSSGSSGGYGNIVTDTGPYNQSFVDWEPGAPSKTVMGGSKACGKDRCFVKESDRIDATKTRYRPLGPNSNSVVNTLLRRCDVPRDKPDVTTPGWDDEI